MQETINSDATKSVMSVWKKVIIEMPPERKKEKGNR